MSNVILFTIGFTKKTAQEFFSILELNTIKLVVDIRLNNSSQLAAFTKQDDLKFFLRRILNCGYVHMPRFAPTDEILKNYKTKSITWADYESGYKKLLLDRNPCKSMTAEEFDHACLLCSEPTPEHCHRRLAAEYISQHYGNIAIKHL